MACLIAPASLAVITAAFRKKFPKHWHIGWLNTMIWGGAVALAVEHVAHKEIVPFPPFLTAMGNPADTAMMLKEIATVGITMAVAIVFAWALIVVIYEKFMAAEKLPESSRAAAKQ